MSKKICVIAFYLALRFSVYSGDLNGGVRWLEGLTWQEVLNKARSENKYLFVDCFTTWCGPCKAMDKNVYPNEKVGSIINEKFLAVKVQMDRTEEDNSDVKQWYKDAQLIASNYKVASYPTLLFFSPEGMLIHKSSQGYNVEGFIDLVTIALDPKKQYYTQLAEYKEGKRDPDVMQILAISAKNFGENELANQIANDFVSASQASDLIGDKLKEFLIMFSALTKAKELASRYIDKLKEQEVYKEDNIRFIRQFTFSSKDRGFMLFYQNSDKINELIDAIPLAPGLFSFVKKGDYAQSLVRQIIYLENIYSPIFSPAFKSKDSTTPNWEFLSEKINHKYPKIDVDRIIIEAKVIWYAWRQDWHEYSKCLVQKMDKIYSPGKLKENAFFINNESWDVFERATDTSLLKRAVYWMEQLFNESKDQRKWTTALDTYANLLYKIGRVSEAISIEEAALKIEPMNKELLEVLHKMKNEVPTWPQERSDFSGLWRINIKKSEYGEAPVTTLIKELKVEQSVNQIKIERKAGKEGEEISSTETLTFDGKTVEQEFDDKIKKSNAKWSNDGKQLIENAFYDYPKDERERKLVEIWSVSPDGRLLTIIRNVEVNGASKYTTKCIYDKVFK